MKLCIEGRDFVDPTWLAEGGEGEIYLLPDGEAAKVYFADQRTTQRKQKVLALCDAQANFKRRHGGRLIAFPRVPAYEGDLSLDGLIGFSMPSFECPSLEKLGFNLDTGEYDESQGVRLDDKAALRIVYDLFTMIDELHESRVILGDINPRNIFVDPASRCPGLWDIDSAQIGSFASYATHPDYNDPAIAEQGVGIDGALTFSCGSDIYSLTIVVFEFLVGVRPFYVHVRPPNFERQNKKSGISVLRVAALGPASLRNAGVEFVDCMANRAVLARLAAVKRLSGDLYQHFESVFLHGERENVLFSLPINDPRNPENRFLRGPRAKASMPSAETIQKERDRVRGKQGLFVEAGFHEVIHSISAASVAAATSPKPPFDEEGDPPAFSQFMHQFGLTLP